MKALVYHQQEDVRVEDVAEPSPGPGMVKLRNAYSGICGSDLHVYYAPETSGLDLTKPHPVTGAMPPQILGHEFSGTVVELGKGVTGVSAGDRVAVFPMIACGQCPACRSGYPNACRNVGAHGLTSDGGGMAEFTTVDAWRLHVLPDSVDLVLGALVEPMAVAWHAVTRSGVLPGQSALILGAGPIGVGLRFPLKARGVDRIIVSEPSPERRAVIAELGADRVVDPISEDLASEVAELTDGLGVDVAFDAAGAGAATLSGLANLIPRGRLVVIALHEKTMELLPTQLVVSEIEMAGSLAYFQSDFDEVIAAMAAGHYSAGGWTDIIGLDDVGAAFGRLRSGQGMKILVESR